MNLTQKGKQNSHQKVNRERELGGELFRMDGKQVLGAMSYKEWGEGNKRSGSKNSRRHFWDQVEF